MDLLGSAMPAPGLRGKQTMVFFFPMTDSTRLERKADQTSLTSQPPSAGRASRDDMAQQAVPPFTGQEIMLPAMTDVPGGIPPPTTEVRSPCSSRARTG